MAIKSGFFNSVGGDRTYNAVDMSMYMEGLISSGVVANPATSMQVTADGTAMSVSVAVGRGLIDYYWIKNDAAYNLNISASNALLNRIDAVVMRYTVANREITLAVKSGTAASNPTAPTMTRNPAVVEYCLATIYVAAGATVISQSNITDTRADRSVCGWVTSLVNNVSAGQIVKYEKSFTTTAPTTTIPITITQYESGDAVLVHLGGMLLRDGYDYVIEGSNIVLLSSAASGRTYTYIVLKLSA